MLSIGARVILNTKVINSECECSWFSVVAPETGSDSNRSVTEGGEVCAKLIVGKNAGFFETVHAFADFHVAVVLLVKMSFGEAILTVDFRGTVAAMNAHVLENFHVGNEKEIFQIAGAVSGTMFGIGDGAVEVEFSIGYADSRRADVLKSIETITTNSHADATRFGFVGTHGADKVGIGDFATMGNLMGKNEEHGVVAGDGWLRGSGGETRGAAAPFIGERLEPDRFVGAVEEGVNGFMTACNCIEHLSSDGRVMLHG